MGVTRVVMKLDGVVVREIALKPGRNLVGRSERAEVFVDDPATSREHCELRLDPDRLVVRDLGATNGILLGGRLVSEAVVGPGQSLWVGGIVLEFRDLPVRVAIPEAPALAAPGPRELEAGTPCCAHHAALPAFFRCGTCGETWCGDCVRVVGRVGGKRHAFCPACHALCAFLPEVARRTRSRGVAGVAKRAATWGRRFVHWLTTGP